MIGETSGFYLGENLLAIDKDLENAPIGFNQPGFYPIPFFDSVRQTDGFGIVFSDCAIFD